MSDIEGVYDEISGEEIMLFNYAKLDRPAALIENQYGAGMFINERLTETTAQQKCAILHEYAHHVTHATHSVHASAETRMKDEFKAVRYAVHRWLPVAQMQQAMADGDTELWQLAERFNVTEEFIRKAFYIYRCEGLL